MKLFKIFLFIFISFLSFGQKTVRGVVTDDLGSPIPGVNILVAGTDKGTTTDFDGLYTIANLNDNDILQFSYIGFITREIKIENNLELNVTLISDISKLDEVVVVGYGTQKKSDIVGSVTVVNIEDALNQPTTDVAELLRGKAAGVQITQLSNRPGGTSSILIRGSNSILGGNSPLFVLDGIPTNTIDDISPNEIESIEVLKDASAQAIYGARASNGVILVNTKKGEDGPLKVSYSGYLSMEELYKNFELYNPIEFINLKREAYRTTNNGEYMYDDEIFTPRQIEVIQSNQYVNWADLVLKNGYISNHNFSVRGGNDKTKVFSNIGLHDQEGLIPGSNFKRLTTRINVQQKINEKTSLRLNTLITNKEQNNESGSIDWIVLPPVAKAFDENGNIIKFPMGAQDAALYNPLWNIKESTNFSDANNFKLDLTLDHNFSKKINYKFIGSLSRRNASNSQYLSSLHQSGVANRGEVKLNDYLTKEYLIENILTYKNKLNENNSFDITFVHSLNEIKYNHNGITGTGFDNDFLGFNGIEAAENISDIRRNANKRTRQGFMGRIRYNLMNKYLFTVTSRYDGSSVFSKFNKYGLFPSFAFGWKINQENFFKNANQVNQLKLRLSFGSIGNEAISPYQSLGLASATNYAFDGQTYVGYLPSGKLYNPNLSWETSTTLNIGLDFGFLNNKLTGTLEYYNTNTTDLLVNRKVNSPGYVNTTYNAGETSNRGFEALVSYDLIRNKNLSWNITSNFAKNNEKIISLYGDLDENGNPIDDVASQLFIGQPINIIYQYVFDGIWQADDDIINSHMPDAQAGEIKLRDISGPDGIPDGQITDDDRTYFKRNPDWFGSISSRINYRNFSFYIDVYFVEGLFKSNPYLADFNSGGTLSGKRNGIKVNYYTPENPSNNYPRPNSDNISYLYSLAVQDASYVKLRTLQLSYNIKNSNPFFKKIKNMSINLTATNLFTFTNYKSYNPEVNPGQYPDGREYTLGLKFEIF